jgi:hypothetical protein
MGVSRHVRHAAASVIVAALSVLGLAGPAAATAATDNSCATRPAEVGEGYSCRLLTESPSGTATPYGEVWYYRSETNHLLVKTFGALAATGTAPVQVCVDDVPLQAQTPGQGFRCSATDATRAYSGASKSVDVNLAGKVSSGAPYYFQVHHKQGGRSTYCGDHDQGGGYNPKYHKPKVSGTEFCVGQRLTYWADGFASGYNVRFSLSDPRSATTQAVGTTKASATGAVSTSVHLPSTGSYYVSATGPAGNAAGQILSAWVQVVDCSLQTAPVASATSSLGARTTAAAGSAGTWLIAAALLLMLVQPMRRRRRLRAHR